MEEGDQGQEFMEGIPPHIDDTISIMEEEEMQRRIKEHGISAMLSPYWVMRKLLAKTMMGREKFGDLVSQVMSNLKEDLFRSLVDMEGVLNLVKALFCCHLVNVDSPPMVPTQPSSARVENSPE